MKTTIERIFETLSKEKIELKSEKIELSSVGELEKEIKKMKSALDYMGKRMVEGEKYIKEFIKYRNFSLDVYSKLSRIKVKMHEVAQEKLDKFEKAAKELGVSVNNVAQVKEIKKLISETEKVMQEQKNLLKDFNRIGIK